MSEIRENIQKLIHSGIPAFRVARKAGIPSNTVSRIFKGEASLDNISLKNAELLNKFYLEQVKENESKGEK